MLIFLFSFSRLAGSFMCRVRVRCAAAVDFQITAKSRRLYAFMWWAITRWTRILHIAPKSELFVKCHLCKTHTIHGHWTVAACYVYSTCIHYICQSPAEVKPCYLSEYCLETHWRKDANEGLKKTQPEIVNIRTESRWKKGIYPEALVVRWSIHVILFSYFCLFAFLMIGMRVCLTSESFLTNFEMIQCRLVGWAQLTPVHILFFSRKSAVNIDFIRNSSVNDFKLLGIHYLCRLP